MEDPDWPLDVKMRVKSSLCKHEFLYIHTKKREFIFLYIQAEDLMSPILQIRQHLFMFLIRPVRDYIQNDFVLGFLVTTLILNEAHAIVAPKF